MKTTEVYEFQWDKGNKDKNLKHEVTSEEAEEVFQAEKKFIFKDELHSKKEERLRILGKTKVGRLLFIVFTLRRGKVRVISARDVNKKEVLLYEKAA